LIVSKKSKKILNSCTDKKTDKNVGAAKGKAKGLIPFKGCEIYVSDKFTDPAKIKLSNVSIEDDLPKPVIKLPKP